MFKDKVFQHIHRRFLHRLLIFIILVSIYFIFSHTSITPRLAFEKSERSALYGPSYVVHEERDRFVHYFLGYYDQWFSCHPVVRTVFGTWRPGNQVHGKEMDKSKPFNYSAGYSTYNDEHFFKVYGIVHDPTITTIELHLTLEGVPQVLRQEELYQNMFLFTLDRDSYDFDKLVGMTSTGKVIYEEVR